MWDEVGRVSSVLRRWDTGVDLKDDLKVSKDADSTD